jgi:hypothetical protein
MRHIIGVSAVLLASLASLAVAGPAQATATTPFTITEQVDFTGEGANTFTATGPLCPAGTFEDDVQTVAAGGAGPDHSGGVNLVIRTVYTCGNGSGSFFALKHVRITFTDTGATNTGPIQLLGGTGSYTGLIGHGVDDGTASGDTGVGLITGFLIA